MNQQVIATIQEKCMQGVGGDELRRIVDRYTGRVIFNVCVGQCKGRTESRPEIVGHYNTHNWGNLQTFKESTAAVGTHLYYLGTRYTVIVNRSTSGDAHIPSKHWFVAVEQGE
jgi:hypothetical protein